MLAVGLGLQKYSLWNLIENGNLVFSPPGHDLSRQKPGDMLLSFHYDFTLLTVHHKGLFPGLYAWTPDGRRFKPQTPTNHYFIHGGKQLEWVTGGFLKAIFHEVYYDQDLEIVRRKAEEKK